MALATAPFNLDSFLDELGAERHLSGNTLAAYRNDLAQFERHLADSRRQGDDMVIVMHPGNATRDEVAGFLLNLRDTKGYSAATIARKLAAVKSLFYYLHRRGEITTNPAADIGAPEV